MVKIPIERLRVLSQTTREGASLSGLLKAGEDLGFKTLGSEIDFNTLKNEAPLPCIIHWNKQHYVVVYKINDKKIFIADPTIGKIKYDYIDFFKYWSYDNSETKEKKVLLFYLNQLKSFHTQIMLMKKHHILLITSQKK